MALDTVPDWGASQSQHTLQVGSALPQKKMHLGSRDGTGPEYIVRDGAQRREIKGQSGRSSQPQWAVTSDNQATIWPSLTRLNQFNKDSTSCNTDWNAKATHTLYGWHPRTKHSAHGSQRTKLTPFSGARAGSQQKLKTIYGPFHLLKHYYSPQRHASFRYILLIT